jgi:hypothetical protein
MKIYRLAADANHYQNIVPIGDKDRQVFNDQFDGRSLVNDWRYPLVATVCVKHLVVA